MDSIDDSCGVRQFFQIQSWLLSVVATATLGCGDVFGDQPYVTRTAPFSPEIPVNESVQYQVRGCVDFVIDLEVDGDEEIALGVDFLDHG